MDEWFQGPFELKYRIIPWKSTMIIQKWFICFKVVCLTFKLVTFTGNPFNNDFSTKAQHGGAHSNVLIKNPAKHSNPHPFRPMRCPVLCCWKELWGMFCLLLAGTINGAGIFLAAPTAGINTGFPPEDSFRPLVIGWKGIKANNFANLKAAWGQNNKPEFC